VVPFALLPRSRTQGSDQAGVLKDETRRRHRIGIVSSIGNNTQEVLASLREAKSGIVRAEKYAELGFRSQVHGAPTLDPSEIVDRRAMRFHAGGTGWNHVAMDQAILDAGLTSAEISHERTGSSWAPAAFDAHGRRGGGYCAH